VVRRLQKVERSSDAYASLERGMVPGLRERVEQQGGNSGALICVWQDNVFVTVVASIQYMAIREQRPGCLLQAGEPQGADSGEPRPVTKLPFFATAETKDSREYP